jgi:hypothetical protein
MISAGQQVQNNQTNQQTGCQQTAYPSPVGPSFTPIQLPAQNFGASAPNISMNWNPGDDFMKPYMWGQFGMQAVGQIASIGQMIANYKLASQAMKSQTTIACKYYDTQDKIAGYQMEVALAQTNVQGKAIDAQVEMHSEQCRHEQALARLNNSVQARLASIAENGKTERARILSMTDAFSRGSWDMGTPAIAA